MKIAIIGVGDMGFPMAKNLHAAGYTVAGYDLSAQRRDALTAAGIWAGERVDEAIAGYDLVITCLPSSEAFVTFAEKALLPLMRAGQVLVEAGTTILYEMRRVAALFAQKGIDVMDAPMSGGPMGVENKRLQMFIGGDRALFDRLLPVFEAIGGPDMVYYCGASGMGQVAKGVNQLYLGLIPAACTEILAYALRENLDPALIHTMFDVKFPSLKPTLAQIEQGGHPGVKFRELPYYIRHAEHAGYALPITTAIYRFMEDGERVAFDDHRQAPSYAHELMKE